MLIGRTQQAVQKKSAGSAVRATRAWDLDSVLAAIADRCGSEVEHACGRIAEWASANADEVRFNTNPTWGSLSPIFDRGGRPFYTFQISTDGYLGITFQYMLGKPVFDALEKRQELMTRLNQIPGFNLQAGSVSKRPLVKLDVLRHPGAVDAFLAVMDWFVAELNGKVEGIVDTAK